MLFQNFYRTAIEFYGEYAEEHINPGEIAGESEAAHGAAGETAEGTERDKERKIWTEYHARGRGKHSVR